MITPQGTILALQSDVVLGHVGLAVTRVVGWAQGIPLLCLPTVLYSNHPGHGGFRGEAASIAVLEALFQGLAERGALKDVALVMSGYLGSPDQAALIRTFVMEVRKANPKALFLCDPVFGDEGGAYAKAGVAEAMARHLIPLADILTPNRFELASLSARQVSSIQTASHAARILGVGEVIATSIPHSGARLATLSIGSNGTVGVVTGRLNGVPHGTGDLLAALFAARRVLGHPSGAALAYAVTATHRVIERCEAGAKDLPLTAARALLADPGPLLPLQDFETL